MHMMMAIAMHSAFEGAPIKRDGHPLEATYAGMLRRCYNKNERQYPGYGGRGISVCERWRDKNGQGFSNFVFDMGPRGDGKSLDRINNDGNYEPSNCCWSDRTTQARNKRTSVKVLVDGHRLPIQIASELTGVKVGTLASRVRRKCRSENILEQGSRLDNYYLRQKRARTHCKNGHEFTSENTYLTPDGYRSCRACLKKADIRRRK